ncbi:outer membrane efflux protein [Sulfuricurvum kujiense DSM 16994]|uniref:Outer membrane efflux protein n=1 Tax=Sulfuricurvum kujiense (strain ATCC BAA-921 / DSM 16994 / JCM 11577 / YK-1) TaxID=709032 RepID=E4U2A3_SULKY|nr:TolC family outer membrane protein [Sulfuricurvum kujiense]ADR33553.1 outer membrane efflux protein [Sulfuricurvum kujiense DSM 16994]
MGKQGGIVKTILAVSVFVSSASLYALDLKSALDEMLQHHPDILQKRQELSAAEHELTIARSGFLPKIDIRSSVAKEKANTQMTGFQNRNFNTVNTNAVLSQNLFSGFSTDSEVEVKRHNIEIKMHELEEKKNDLSLRLIKSYLDVVKASILLDVERKNVKAHEEMYQKIKLKTQSGSGRMADYKEVLSKLALSYVNTLTQDNNYNDASTVLNTVMGRYTDVSELVKPSLEVSVIPRTLEEAVKEAVEKNPMILVGRAEIESAKKSVSLERSSYYPKVDAELNTRSYNNANGTENIDKTTAAMVTLSYNLYNGGSDSARIKRSLSQTYNAIERFRSIERDVAEKMTIAYNAYTVFNRQKPFLEVYSDASFEKTQYYEEEFDLGRRSLIDLLDSENEYCTARRKEVENEFELLYSYFRVLAAKNGLMSYFGIDGGGYSPKNYTLSERVESTVNVENAPSIGEYPFIVSTVQIPLKDNFSKSENNVSVMRVKETNLQKGYENYLKAARLGDKESQRVMVELYAKGIGTAPDADKARYWKNRYVRKGSIAANSRKVIEYKELANRYLPIQSVLMISESKNEVFSAPKEKAKSLDERLKELGIILNGLKK